MSGFVTSTVPAVADAFLSRVADLIEFVDVQVGYGPPGGTVETTSLWLDSASPWEQGMPESPGFVARSEQYLLNGNLWRLAHGDTAIEARDAAFTMFAAVEKMLRADMKAKTTDGTPLLGVAGVLVLWLMPQGSHPFIGDDGYGHHIEFALDVHAYLGLSN